MCRSDSFCTAHTTIVTDICAKKLELLSTMISLFYCRAKSSNSVGSSLDSQGISVEIDSESTEDSSEINYQNILFEAYASIGEPDEVYCSGVSNDLKTRIHTYEQEKYWGKALSKFNDYFWFIVVIRRITPSQI